MSNKIAELGGIPMGKEEATSADFNNSFSAAVNPIGNLAAEAAYKNLASALSFFNGDSLAAEDFTSAGGANNTVNIGDTDAAFDTDHYSLPLDLQESATAISDNATTSAGYSFDCDWNNVSASGIVTKVLVNVNGPDTVTVNIKKGAVVVATKQIIGNDNIIFEFGASDYSDTFANGETATVQIVEDTPTTYRVRTGYTFTGTNFSISPAPSFIGAPFTGSESPVTMASAGGFVSDSEVVCDTNTLAVDDSTNAFALHWQGDFPTDTSGKFVLIDGSANEVEFVVDSVTKKTGVIPKGALTNVDNVIIKAVLETTDSGVTPTIFGFGIVKL